MVFDQQKIYYYIMAFTPSGIQEEKRDRRENRFIRFGLYQKTAELKTILNHT